MKVMLAVIGLTILIIWDFTQNNGHMTEAAVRWVTGMARSFGY